MSTNMARTNSGSGFSVSQPTLNSPLLFCPAMGTQELDDLINAYVPGSASLQEKRAFVSMEFFNYAHASGESFRYFSVPSATSSAGSSPMQDSAYGSSFVSPALTNWSWPQSVSASTPSTSFSQEFASQAKPAKKASPAASSRGSPADFSHLPGMKIMTKDGRDVTNSASRGCKTKEQRDHAHLMRIIKACDACKKKKIRCDPSHKKRSSGATPVAQTATPSASRSKATAKRRQPTVPEPQIPASQHFMPSMVPSFSEDTLFADLDLSQMDAMASDWDAFVQYDDVPMDGAVPEYDFFLDPAGYFTNDSSNSTSPSSSAAVAAAREPALQTVFAQEDAFAVDLQQPVSHAPVLPYMASGVPGNDYVDFNLFSPATSFVDDESLPITDIGGTSSGDAYAALPESALLGEPTRASVGGQNIQRQQFVRRRDRPEDLVSWDDDVRWEGVNANVPAHGGAESANNTAVANVHGLAYYATSPRPEPPLPPRTTQPDAPSAVVNATDSPATTDVSSSSPTRTDLHTESRTDGASRRPVSSSRSSSSCGSEEGSGAGLVIAPSDSPRPRDVQYALHASGLATSSKVSVLQDTVPSPSGLAIGVPGKVTSWVNDGAVCDVARAPKKAVSSVQEDAVTRAGYSTHDITAMVALGVLAARIPAVSAAALIQLALGLMVLGALFSSTSTKHAFAGQRIRGTTPLPSTYQEERQGHLSPARSYAACWARWPTAHHHSCRQMENAHPVSAVGRLATLRLLALTQ